VADLAVFTQQQIVQRIEESIAVKQRLLQQSTPMWEVAQRLIDAYAQGGKLVTFGNGGSAADAQHIAAEFVGKYYLYRRALPALALTVNTSALTSIANDFDYSQVFARQIEAIGATGDIAIGLSTSGSSTNVVEGLRAARRRGMITVGLTGAAHGAVRLASDYCICIPSDDTPRIQESHILIGHIWSEAVEHALFANDADQAPEPVRASAASNGHDAHAQASGAHA